MLQFDVFPGYDGLVLEASWFPVVCEIKNEGPSFKAVVELSPGNYNQGQMRRVEVELPTGTLKRLVIPVFSNTRGYVTWDVRLLDERGRVRAEQPGVRPRRQLAANTPLVGALPRTAGGTPSIKQIQSQQSEMQPGSARLLPAIFPDNPLVLEGMSSLYLNSEKAPDLKVNQVKALQAWLHAGGHLIVAVEQISEINSVPWLKELFPCDLKDIRTLKVHPELQEWLRTMSGPTNFASTTQSPMVRYGRLPGRPGQRPPRVVPAPGTPAEVPTNPYGELSDDMTFEAAELQVATGPLRDGAVLVAVQDTPLIVTANRGRGRVTALMFSPEREPVRSWKNLPAFWAKLAEVPALYYTAANASQQGGYSSDGIFGAMIDTKQVHKLPVEWLLLLLIVYLVVIGPLDQFWLKRIGKPMLTWITFPCYVVLFSLLIYFIGYRLRAGESEWNELHLVDVLARGDAAELRGRTYATIYSPSNQKYILESQQKYATLRGEFAGLWGGGQSTEKATVLQTGDSFRAEVFVPVWTSQLFISDWWQSSTLPLNVLVATEGDQWQVKVENRTEHKLENTQLVISGYIIALGDVEAKETKSFTVSRDKGRLLKDFVSSYSDNFQEAVQSRQRAFGASESGRIADITNSAVAASFISQSAQHENFMSFLSPPGLDLSAVAEHGNAVLFAWAGDYAPTKPINQFSPRRIHRNTLWRVAVPVR